MKKKGRIIELVLGVMAHHMWKSTQNHYLSEKCQLTLW